MSKKKKVKLTIGIVGPICAGKETAGEYLLKKYKARYYSLSDVIREELDFLGFDRHSRDLLQAIGNELRHHRGADYLARKIVDKIKTRDYSLNVIGSIRNPDEVKFLSNNLPNFYLFSVNADQKIRFKRLLKRKRDGDPKDWEGFLEADKREFDQRGKELFHIQVDTASELADFSIDNSKDKKYLFRAIDHLVNKLLNPSIKNRERVITIAVGSRNQVKITGVTAATEKIYPNANIIGVGVDSGVAPTPFSDEESIKGAINRAEVALKKAKTNLAVGLEGGIKKVGQDYFLTLWAAVLEADGRKGLGSASSIQIPAKVTNQLKKERELIKSMQGLIKTRDIDSRVGAVGILTKGLVRRSREAELATLSAFAKFVSPEHYKRGK